LKLIEIPSGELAAPTNDINTTAALAILTSLTYFSAGFSIKGIDILNAMFNHRPSYYQLTLLKILLNQYLYLFPIIWEHLADELVAVLCLLVPILIPVPVMVLGLFASSLL
jgi:F-type H+-transporting ATPase subunit a